MTKAGASERALKAAEEVRSLAMDYFGYATATGDTNAVYQKFPVTGVAAIIDAESPDTLSQLSALYSDHAAWSQVTFGTDTERGPLGPLKHLEKEAREAQQEPFNAYEHADCLLLVLDASRRSGLTLQALIHAAEQKLVVNKQREWPKGREPDDMIQHTGPPSDTIRTCNKCGYVGPLVLHPPCPYMSCIVPEAVGTLDEALSQEVVLQKRIEKLKGGLKAAWNVANLAANGNIKMKSIITEQKERIAELERQLATETTAYEGIAEKYVKIMDDLSPSPCGVKGHCKVDRRTGKRRVVEHICTPYSGDCAKLHPSRIGKQRTWRSGKPGNSRIYANRRITNSGGYCVRCMEIEKAALERARDAASATVTEFVQAVKTIAPLPANTWTQTWPPEVALARLVEYVKLEQQQRIAELERRLATKTTAYERIAEKYVKIMDDLSPSPCGVKGHCKVSWTERRAGERRGNAVPGIEDRRKYGSGGSWLERRITSLRGHCGRCEEVEQATDTALIGAEKGVSVIIDNTIEKAVTEALEAAGQYIPGDLRALGWSVAIHNDYRQDGKFHTFWLLTKGGQCVKGEGESDAEALNQIRVAIRGKEEKWRQ